MGGGGGGGENKNVQLRTLSVYGRPPGGVCGVFPLPSPKTKNPTYWPEHLLINKS